MNLRNEGYTYKEISEELNVKYTTITSWLSKNQKPRIKKNVNKTYKDDIFFMIPILKEGKENVQINIKQYINYGIVKDDYIFTPNPANEEKIWGEKHKMLNILNVDEDFCLLSGYYIAEGSQGNLSFNKDETDYHNDVISIMKSKFNKDVKLTNYDNSNGISLQYNSKILDLLFEKLFGHGACNKQIPEMFMSLPNNKLKELIKGYWRGDGYYSSNGYRYHVSICSTSLKLLNQIKMLLMRFGILSSIHKRERKQLLNFEGRKKYKFDGICYDLMITGEYARDFLTNIADIKNIEYPKRYNFNYKDDNYMYVKLSDINIQKYEGKIYNFEVEDDHTYLIPVVAHNCFGTVLNRFIVQAFMNVPLTVYGEGEQQRGFLALNDSIQCLMLAIKNPAIGYRTWNQFAEPYSIMDLTRIIEDIFYEYNINVNVEYIETPRVENTKPCYYHAKTDKLEKMGFEPTTNIANEIRYIIDKIKSIDLINFYKMIKPKINWRYNEKCINNRWNGLYR